MGFSLRAERFLTAADSRRPERVCVVDELAACLLPSERAARTSPMQALTEE
jgi:hypothetical protein